MDFPGGASGKEPTCQCRRQERLRFDPWVRKIPCRKAWQPTPVLSPGESHGQRSLVAESRTRLKWLGTQMTHWHGSVMGKFESEALPLALVDSGRSLRSPSGWNHTLPAEAGQGHLLPARFSPMWQWGFSFCALFFSFLCLSCVVILRFHRGPKRRAEALSSVPEHRLWCTSRGRCVWDEFCSDVSHRLWIQGQPASTIH